MASGEKLSLEQGEIRPSGASIECRITAEDVLNDFAPDSGLVSKVSLPGGRGVRVDSYLRNGTIIPEYYDSLVAKIITRGKTLEEARKLMLIALDELEIVGVKTNIAFHKEVLTSEAFINWQLSTDFIQEERILEKIQRKESERKRKLELYGAIALSVMLSKGIHRDAEIEQEKRKKGSYVRSRRFFDLV